MTQAKNGDTVKVHYTGKLADETVFDSSVNRDPLQFKIGDGQIIPGFEKIVIGMDTGEKKVTTIVSDQAYGPHRKDMVFSVDRDKFPPNIQPEVGQQLQMPQADDQKIVVTVTKVSESNVTLDANHPLAGKDLTFEIQLVEII